jgi:hypothetical protein
MKRQRLLSFTHLPTFVVRHRMALAAASLLPVLSAFADQTWVGGVSGSWNNPANWSGGTVPAASEVAIFDTPGAVVTVDAAAAIKMLRVRTPATLTLNAPFTISNDGK